MYLLLINVKIHCFFKEWEFNIINKISYYKSLSVFVCLWILYLCFCVFMEFGIKNFNNEKIATNANKRLGIEFLYLVPRKELINTYNK